MAMSDSQWYPWKLYLINNVEDIIVFLGLRKFNSYACSGSKNARVNSVKNMQLKKISFWMYKHGYLIHTWSDEAFKSTVGNRTLSSFLGGSLEITLTVPLTIKEKKVTPTNIFYSDLFIVLK